ncbi:MAG: hypothetical protein DRH26_14825 [Deltaproteobacteria bacterium]|nr:MAG: hypothetical protein DRH26_14825 [Deltaproteobacteria bacterium]
MQKKINMNSTYARSPDVIARQIEDEYIIIPLVGGIGNIDDCLFSMNKTGKKIWDMLDGIKSLNGIVGDLILEYDIQKDQAKKDVKGFLQELFDRQIVKLT